MKREVRSERSLSGHIWTTDNGREAGSRGPYGTAAPPATHRVSLKERAIEADSDAAACCTSTLLQEGESRAESVVHASQSGGRKLAELFDELAAIERGDLVAQGDALFPQAAGPFGKRDGGRAPASLRCRGGERHYDDRTPRLHPVEPVVRNDHDRTTPRLLGARPRHDVGPEDIAALHRLRRLPRRCSIAARSRPSSRSAAVPAISVAYVAIASWTACRSRSSTQASIASRATLVVGRLDRIATARKRS
jgi:hypothetical protein